MVQHAIANRARRIFRCIGSNPIRSAIYVGLSSVWFRTSGFDPEGHRFKSDSPCHNFIYRWLIQMVECVIEAHDVGVPKAPPAARKANLRLYPKRGTL